MGTATDTCTAADVVIITAGAEAVGITTAGGTTTVITNAAPSPEAFAFANHCPGESDSSGERTGRAARSRPVQSGCERPWRRRVTSPLGKGPVPPFRSD